MKSRIDFLNVPYIFIKHSLSTAKLSNQNTPYVLRILSLILFFVAFIATTGHAQDSTSFLSKATNFPNKLFSSLNKKATATNDRLNKSTIAYLNRLRKQEKKLQKKVTKKDPALAAKLFTDIDKKYDALLNPSPLSKVGGSVYSPHLDSLTTAVKFLDKNNLGQVSQLNSSYGSLQQNLNHSEEIKKFIKERESLLAPNLEKLGIANAFKSYQKQAYYYSAQVADIKSTFEDPNKLEKKLLEELVKRPEFKDFFRKNSVLGSLFALPGDGSGSTASLQGLQTRASISQSITSRFGSGPNVTQMLQQNIQEAKGQLQELKNKASSYLNGAVGNSSGDIPPPKNFHPNNQKTKTFLQRLEYGFNIQNQKKNGILPVTSDLGLQLGYKLHDKSSIGVGASYKLGLGEAFKNFKLSSEGVGLRSFADYQLKGSFFLTGGYELNYRPTLSGLSLPSSTGGVGGGSSSSPTGGGQVGAGGSVSEWTKSGLIGLCKKYRVSKKMKGEMKLLWDLLSYQQVPRTQAVLFRIGYNLK